MSAHLLEGENPSAEPSVSDLETWLEYQSTQIGTPMWWKELGAVQGITDQQKFMPRKFGHHFIYQKSGPGCLHEKDIPCLLPPEA